MSTEKSDQYFAQLLADPFGQADDLSLPAESKAQAKPLYENLSEKEKKQAQAIAKMLVSDKMNSIADYGAKAQQQLDRFAHGMLKRVQSKDTGEIGENLRALMVKLERADLKQTLQQEKNPLRRLFKRAETSIYELNAKFQEVAVQVDRIAQQLDQQQNILRQDNEHLEGLYQENLQYFKVLNVYIAGAELKLQELKDSIIPQKTRQLQKEASQLEAQKLADLKAFTNRLDKRVYDLKVTRQVTIQQAPQIRLLQNTNQALAEKIQASIHTAIPLWKNQMAIQLSLNRQKEALEAQRAVSETTNQLMRKNAQLLHQQTTDIARENERGVVDLETLTTVQENLVQTIQETFDIQQAGQMKRQEAELELQNMEAELRNYLLEQMTTGRQKNEAKIETDHWD